MQQLTHQVPSSDTRRLPGIVRLDSRGIVRAAMGDVHDPVLHEFLQTEDDPPGSIESAIGRSLADLLDPGAELDAALHSLRNGSPAQLRGTRPGRRFQLTLAPYRDDDGRPRGALCLVAAHRDPPPDAGHGGPIRVLIVDDDGPSRVLARGHVNSALADTGGTEVREARDGVDALQVMAGFLPDLVLLDLHMPVMDGWALLRALHLDPRYKRIPVIAISANETTEAEGGRLRSDTYGLAMKGRNFKDQFDEAIRLVREDDFVAPDS